MSKPAAINIEPNKGAGDGRKHTSNILRSNTAAREVSLVGLCNSVPVSLRASVYSLLAAVINPADFLMLDKLASPTAARAPETAGLTAARSAICETLG
jgi:hypothetical protein